MIAAYMTRFFGEDADFRGLAVNCERLIYVDETADDRDSYGVLWMRHLAPQPDGHFDFGRARGRRQRDIVLYLRCLLCAGDPDENGDGLLWLTAGLPNAIPAGSPLTPYPPICAACFELARTACPALLESHTIMRVTGVEVYGVQGAALRLREGRVVMDETGPAVIGYGDRRQEMFLAMRQVLRLTNFRILDDADHVRAAAATSN